MGTCCGETALISCNVTRENMSQSEFRFAVIRIWYAMFRKTNGTIEVLHYPVNKQTHHRRSLAMTVTSPRKGPTPYKEFPRKILQAKINASNAAFVARKHSNTASVQALGTLWSFAVQTQVDSAGINIISLENMTYQVANPRRKHKDYR